MKDWNELKELIQEFELIQDQAQVEELNILIHQIFALIERLDLTIAQSLFLQR